MDSVKAQWLKSLDTLGVTGDLCAAIMNKAKEIFDANPTSVFSYATWRACEELARYFNDDQGIPFDESVKITESIREPLRHLIISGGVEEENKEAFLALSELILALHEVRHYRRITSV